MEPSASPATFEVGSTIAGTYRIEGHLGRGGMGLVLLASHTRLPGKQVAIKVLHAHMSSDEMLARFQREAQIASLLAHPNIVHIEDYNVTPDGSPYLVLEYLQGESLAQRLARGPIAFEAAMSIVRQIGSALAIAHAKGIVHRDLKPQNIFLVPTEVDGRPAEIVKVLDFGISKMIDSHTVMTEENALLGTPQYMAPEQATGQHGTIDVRTDIFSFGAIVYEMLSGQPAFTGKSVPEIVFKVVYEEPLPLPPSVAPAIVDAIRRAMAKQGADRFSNVSSFVEAVTGKRISVPVVPHSEAFAPTMDSTTPVPLTTLSEPRQRARLFVIAACAGAAAVVLAIVMYFALRASPRRLDDDSMRAIAVQVMTAEHVDIDGKHFHVGLTPKHLRIAKFEIGDHVYEAIEQNPATGTRWAELAHQGHAVVQFKDLATGRYFAVVVDGTELHRNDVAPSEP